MRRGGLTDERKPVRVGESPNRRKPGPAQRQSMTRIFIYHGKVDIQYDVVVNGQSQNDTNESELSVRLETSWIEPELITE